MLTAQVAHTAHIGSVYSSGDKTSQTSSLLHGTLSPSQLQPCLLLGDLELEASFRVVVVTYDLKNRIKERQPSTPRPQINDSAHPPAVILLPGKPGHGPYRLLTVIPHSQGLGLLNMLLALKPDLPLPGRLCLHTSTRRAFRRRAPPSRPLLLRHVSSRRCLQRAGAPPPVWAITGMSWPQLPERRRGWEPSLA